MPLDTPNGSLQHIAHFAGLQMSKAREDKLVPLLVPRAIECDRMEMRVETQIGRCPLYRSDRAGLRTHGTLRRSTYIERLHRIHEDLCEPAEQFAVLGQPRPPREREGQHPLPKRG